MCILLILIFSGNKMSESWAQEQVKKFTFNFEEADKDGNGSLSESEVFQVLKNSGFRGSDQEAKVGAIRSRR